MASKRKTSTEEGTSKAHQERTRAQAMCERAIVLAVELERMARELERELTPDREEALSKRIEAMWAAFHGWSIERVHRMKLVEAVQHAADEMGGTEGLRVVLDSPKLEAAVDWIVRTAVSHDQPAVAEQLKTATIETVVRAWHRRGSQRASAREPLLWDALASLVAEGGFGSVKPDSLRQDWLKWCKLKDV